MKAPHEAAAVHVSEDGHILECQSETTLVHVIQEREPAAPREEVRRGHGAVAVEAVVLPAADGRPAQVAVLQFAEQNFVHAMNLEGREGPEPLDGHLV